MKYTLSEGIKPSRKWANGTLHENASGKFQVLDRYLDIANYDEPTIIIKYQWLDSGEIEENKEVNLSSSVYKFQKSRGLLDEPASARHALEAVTLQELNDKLELIREFQETNIEGYQDYIIKIHDAVFKQGAIIEKLVRKIDQTMAEVHELNKKYNLAEKLVEKI